MGISFNIFDLPALRSNRTDCRRDVEDMKQARKSAERRLLQRDIVPNDWRRECQRTWFGTKAVHHQYDRQ